MSLVLSIALGTVGSKSITVNEEHTAPFVGSGRVSVLATPVMINLFEAAALEAIEHLLPEGHQSLGTHLDITHVAATPVGMQVTARAEVIDVSGRIVKFKVSARDQVDLIGEGVHDRVIVNVAKFDLRVQHKIEACK